MQSIAMEECAGGIILNQKGDILIVQNKNLSWSLPKGHIELGEDPLTAAYREIKEETGLDKITYIKTLPSYTRSPFHPIKGFDTSKHKRIHVFLFTTEEIIVKPIDLDNPEARWVKREVAADLLTNPGDKEYIEKILTEL